MLRVYCFVHVILRHVWFWHWHGFGPPFACLCLAGFGPDDLVPFCLRMQSLCTGILSAQPLRMKNIASDACAPARFDCCRRRRRRCCCCGSRRPHLSTCLQLTVRPPSLRADRLPTGIQPCAASRDDPALPVPAAHEMGWVSTAWAPGGASSAKPRRPTVERHCVVNANTAVVEELFEERY